MSFERNMNRNRTQKTVQKTMSKAVLHSQNDTCNADSESVGTDEETCSSEDHSFWLFKYLPAELTQKIFSYFSHYQLCRNIAPVCRRWRDFAYDPIHWQKLELTSKFKVQPYIMRKLFGRTRLLKHLVLNIRHSYQFLIYDLSMFDSVIPCLRELHITHFESLDANYLKYVLQNTPGLEHLNIEECTMVKQKVESDILRKLFDGARLLKHLVLSDNRGIQFSIDDLRISGIEMPRLRELHMTHFKSLDADYLKCVLQKAPGLEHLNIEKCTMVNDSCIEEICRLDKLKALNISHCRGITDSGLMQLARGIKCLNVLNIEGMNHISERSIESLVETQFQHLRHLYMDGQGKSNLRYLSRCSNLETLSISWAEFFNDSFLASIRNLSNLEVLRLMRGKKFTSSALKTFFENTTIKKLTNLDLSECSLLDDSVLAVICSRYGRFLNKLSLSWCGEVTDVGLEAIVSNCRVLRHLDLRGLQRINGRCFQNIPDLMPCLTFLDLKNCNFNMIDDSVLSAVVCRKTDITINRPKPEPRCIGYFCSEAMFDQSPWD